MYEKIKKWYRQGLWQERQIQQAVEKGLLTGEEYRQITGGEYRAIE